MFRHKRDTMKKLPPSERRTTISIPLVLKREVQKVCFDLDVSQQEIVVQLLKSWLEKQKRKQNQTSQAAVSHG